MKNWPSLSDFEATVGRLATAEDTRANRAAFLLTADGVRIGVPISMRLPIYAWFIDGDSGRGGVFTKPISECVSFIDEAIVHGKKG